MSALMQPFAPLSSSPKRLPLLQPVFKDAVGPKAGHEFEIAVSQFDCNGCSTAYIARLMRLPWSLPKKST